jgi:hypothetical protein
MKQRNEVLPAHTVSEREFISHLAVGEDSPGSVKTARYKSALCEPTVRVFDREIINVLGPPPWVDCEMRPNCELAKTEEGLSIFQFLFGGVQEEEEVVCYRSQSWEVRETMSLGYPKLMVN